MWTHLINPRHLGAWLLFALLTGLAHVLTVLAMAETTVSPRLAELHQTTPANQFAILQPVTPTSQPFAFMMPENLYAICPFDVGKTPVRIEAVLPDVGWVLSLHTLDGGSFYFAPGVRERTLSLTLDIIPPGDALNGLELAARPADMQIAKAEAPAAQGFAIVRAPLIGKASAPDQISMLEKSSCRPVGRTIAARQ